jgi:hypothetical protein
MINTNRTYITFSTIVKRRKINCENNQKHFIFTLKEFGHALTTVSRQRKEAKLVQGNITAYKNLIWISKKKLFCFKI